jgi:hypothetical protein
VINSIVGCSTSSNSCFGPIIDGGNNISSDASCNFTAAGSLNNTDPRLGPLGDYGGPTPTMPLLAGSPAINAALSSACPSTDQRGIARPYGAACDIGAFESAPPYTIRGHVGPYLSATGTSISAGGFTTTVNAAGFYALTGLPPGTYTMTPSAPDAVFVLSNQVHTLGPDVLNADFHSYRSNGWSVVRATNNALDFVLAGATGQTWRVFVSTNLNNWVASSTNIIPSSGILEFNEATDQPQRFFKAVQP